MQSQEFRNLARQLKDNLSRLMEKRSNWESHWQEVADYMLPRKAEITKQRAAGDKRNISIFDATPIHALELLAASLHGMLTSSANRWFSLRFKETELNDSDEAKEWLEDTTQRMYDVIAKSNFQQEIFECYHDLIAFGTACLMIEEDDEDTDNKKVSRYNYLLKMPISQLTYDRKIILEKEHKELEDKLNALKNTNIEDIWMNDLVELEKAWESHRDGILVDYDNDLKGIVETKAIKKKKK